MGVTWRRINERVLQMGSFTSFNNKAFSATSNGRNEAMFAEATEFAKSIMTLQKDVGRVLKYVEVHFENLCGILNAPIPRIYDEGPNGPVPLENECLLLGQGMDVDAITRSIQDAKYRVKTEVMDPLMEWMEAYKVLTERMKSLESVRLELDSRRRTVGGLQSRYDRLRSTMTTNHKAIAETREMEGILAHKEEKMARCLSQFQELERTVYNSLYTLVKDTSVLRDYTHSTLLIIQACFEQAAIAYSCAAASPSPNVAMTHKHLQSNSKPTKSPLAGMFEKLMGKKQVPDTKRHKDQAPPFQDTAPLALPAPPQQLMLQGTSDFESHTVDQDSHSCSTQRAQWHQHPQPSGSPVALPAPSAASGTNKIAFSGTNKAAAGYLPAQGSDQQLASGGYYADYNDAKDVGCKYQHKGMQPYPQPGNLHHNYQVYQPPALELHPAGAFYPPNESPLPPPCPAPGIPAGCDTPYRLQQFGQHPVESGWTAQGV